MNAHLIRWMFWIPCVVLVACGGTPDHDPHAADDAEEEHDADEGESSSALEIPPSVRANLGLSFAKVEARRVAQTIRVPGAFELEPLARQEYRMTLPGTVELLVDQYTEVEEGRALYRFRSPTWPELLHEIIEGEQSMDSALADIEVAKAHQVEARAKLALMRERLEALAQADFKRADLELAAAELEAELPRLAAELQRAETKLANAERTREHALHRAAAAAGIHEHELERMVPFDGGEVPLYATIEWIEVRAREAGVVEQLAVTNGAFVEPPQLILSTVDPERVRFRALGLQADLPKLMAADTAHIVPPRTAGIAPDDVVPAKLTVGLEAHPRERTLTLLAKPESLTSWMRNGVSAFLEVQYGSSDGLALAIPSSAILTDGLTRIFFRRDPRNPDRALRVEADLGVSDGRWTVVKSGVARGDEVVLDGAYELRLALSQGDGPPAGGHVHADGSSHDDH